NKNVRQPKSLKTDPSRNTTLDTNYIPTTNLTVYVKEAGEFGPDSLPQNSGKKTK
ncbi:unnamed protein product, partial [Rotaria magnacalcarata]